MCLALALVICRVKIGNGGLEVKNATERRLRPHKPDKVEMALARGKGGRRVGYGYIRRGCREMSWKPGSKYWRLVKTRSNQPSGILS